MGGGQFTLVEITYLGGVDFPQSLATLCTKCIQTIGANTRWSLAAGMFSPRYFFCDFLSRGDEETSKGLVFGLIGWGPEGLRDGTCLVFCQFEALSCGCA
jgi:hypothetical protein